MLILDRVVCDFCGALVGQLYGAPVQSVGVLADQRIAPYFCVCPDCYDQSTFVESIN